MWIFLRALVLAPYFILDTNIRWLTLLYKNNSDIFICPDLDSVHLTSRSETALIVMVAIFSVSSLVRYIYDAILAWSSKKPKATHDLNGKKNIFSSASFYTTVQFLLLVLILVLNILYIVVLIDITLFEGAVSVTIDFFRSIIPVLFVWSVCFFLQLVPGVSYSVISLQAMLRDVGKVLLLYVVILLPFVHVFQAYSLGNSVDGCLAQFSSPGRTAYSLFMVMLNQIDMTQFKMYNPGILYLLHCLYVFMVA